MKRPSIVTVSIPPLGSNFFKENQTIAYKEKSKGRVTSHDQSAPNSGVQPFMPQGPAPGYHLPFGLSPYAGHPMMPHSAFYSMHPQMGYAQGYPTQPYLQPYTQPHAGPSWQLPMAATATKAFQGDLHEWCLTFELSEGIYDGLHRLDFELGQSVLAISEDMWDTSGLTIGEREAFLKAYSAWGNIVYGSGYY
jgi:hypothetical protein